MYNIIMQLKNLYSFRKIVIHHTHLLNDVIPTYLKMNDIVFFDDCLYSQYLFIKRYSDFFIKNHIICVLGFSSGLYSVKPNNQIYNVQSNVLHNICNQYIKTLDDANILRESLNEMNGFMTIEQLYELKEYPFIEIALHGCCHLNLHNLSTIDAMQIFINDLKDGINQIHKFNVSTDIYVYPYVYSLPSFDFALHKYGFNKIIGSNNMFRYAIEDLVSHENAALYVN